MLPSFGDDAMEAARYALVAMDRTPATSDLLDVIERLIEYAEWVNIELAQAERQRDTAEAKLAATETT